MRQVPEGITRHWTNSVWNDYLFIFQSANNNYILGLEAITQKENKCAGLYS